MYRSRYNRLEENAEETNADNVQEPQQNGQQWAFESMRERMSKDKNHKMPTFKRLLFYLLKHSIFWIWP